MQIYFFSINFFLGYAEKEIMKEGWKIPDYGENPKAPFPKEMNDLEVTP